MVLHVVRSEYRGEFRVHLWFNDQTDGEVDLQPHLDGPIFEPLKNIDQFKRFSLEGHTIAWPNGADFAPEFLHGLIHARALA
jgi:hypothetical protein